MEKYATYEVYRNKETGKIKKVPYEGEQIKLAEDNEVWEKLDKDPEAEEANE